MGGSACSGGGSGGVADTESLRGGNDGTTIAGIGAETSYDLAATPTTFPAMSPATVPLFHAAFHAAAASSLSADQLLP